jgi:porin
MAWCMRTETVTAVLTGSLALLPAASWADEKSETANGVPSPSIATSLSSDIADPGGVRAALASKGVTYQLNYIGEALSDVSGGAKRGSIYEGRLEFVLDGDLEKLAGWSGAAFHLNAYQIHGKGLSREYVGNLMPVSNIEALPSTRLYEAWFEQKLLDDKLAVRLGQLGADTEFLTSNYAGLFVNGTFGWPTVTAVDLPSGGPAYPLATPAVRLKFDPNPQSTFLLGVFNGDPAGPGPGDPQERDRNGLNFRVQDPPFVIGEAQYKYNQEKDAKGLPGTIKLGAWTHFGNFDDLRYDTSGLPLADPLSNQMPLQHRYNFGLYGVIDQQIYRLSGGDADQGVGIFARASASPSDRNLVDFYFDAGVNFNGMIKARPDDSFGVAVAYAGISNRAQGFDQDQILFSGVNSPVRDYEAALEFTYQAQIVPGWTVQPDLQYIFHPGGHIPNSLNGFDTAPIRDALVVGVRSTVKY